MSRANDVCLIQCSLNKEQRSNRLLYDIVRLMIDASLYNLNIDVSPSQRTELILRFLFNLRISLDYGGVKKKKGNKLGNLTQQEKDQSNSYNTKKQEY